MNIIKELEKHNKLLQEHINMVKFTNIIINLNGNLTNLFEYRDHNYNNLLQAFVNNHGITEFKEFGNFVMQIEGGTINKWFSNINSAGMDLCDILKKHKYQKYKEYEHMSITKKNLDRIEKIRLESLKQKKFNCITNLQMKIFQFWTIFKNCQFDENYKNKKYIELLEVDSNRHIKKLKCSQLIDINSLEMFVSAKTNKLINTWFNANLHYEDNNGKKIHVKHLTFEERSAFKLESCFKNLSAYPNRRTVLEIFIDLNMQNYVCNMISNNLVWITPRTLDSYVRCANKTSGDIQMFIRKKIVGYYLRYSIGTHNK